MADERSELALVRDVVNELEVDAPADAVWKALTDADELIRWFPIEARVTAGAGGTIAMHWPGEPFLESTIEIWTPGHHLRTVGLGGVGELVTDYFLEARGGTTVLRVVTSGFGPDASWDNLVEGVRLGWQFQLVGLKHYLEQHRGRVRQVASASVPIAEYEDAWSRLRGSSEWLPGELAAGEPFSIEAGGQLITGVVRSWEPPRQFFGQVEDWNDALVCVSLFCSDGMGKLTAWLFAYDVPETQLRAVESGWQASLDKLFAV